MCRFVKNLSASCVECLRNELLFKTIASSKIILLGENSEFLLRLLRLREFFLDALLYHVADLVHNTFWNLV